MANPGSAIIPISIALTTFLIVFLLFFKVEVFNEQSTWIKALILSAITVLILSAYNAIMAFVICPKKGEKFGEAFGISIIFPIVAILIASFDKCRIPIASILQPLNTNSTETITGGRRNKLKGGLSPNESDTSIPTGSSTEKKSNKMNVTNTTCCEKTYQLTEIESQNPGIKGAAYGFYIFFSMIYAITYSNSLLSC